MFKFTVINNLPLMTNQQNNSEEAFFEAMFNIFVKIFV